MSNLPDRSTFENLYTGQAPWDIGRPQAIFVNVADQISGSVLDAGCGTGENALFFAARGNEVLGIDYLEEPIRRAIEKARERDITAKFQVGDALQLSKLSRQFDQAIDSGLFHVFSNADRAIYVSGLAQVIKPGGKLYLLCFSDKEPGTQGPRRIAQSELEAAFAQGWRVVSLKAAQFETIPDLKGMTFSPGGPQAWFAIIERL